MSHTQERLTAGAIFVSEITGQPVEFHCVGVDGTNLAVAITGIVGNDRDETSSADARRIAACWNACQDVSIDLLEAAPMSTVVAQMAKKISDQTRDELLEALKALVDYLDERTGDTENRPLENARAAINKATGGDA